MLERMSWRTTPLSVRTSGPLVPSPGNGPAVSSGMTSHDAPAANVEPGAALEPALAPAVAPAVAPEPVGWQPMIANIPALTAPKPSAWRTRRAADRVEVEGQALVEGRLIGVRGAAGPRTPERPGRAGRAVGWSSRSPRVASRAFLPSARTIGRAPEDCLRDASGPDQNARRRMTRPIRITKKPATRTSSGCESDEVDRIVERRGRRSRRSRRASRGRACRRRHPATWPAGPLLMPPPYSITRASSHRAQAHRISVRARAARSCCSSRPRRASGPIRTAAGRSTGTSSTTASVGRSRWSTAPTRPVRADREPGLVAVDVEAEDLDDARERDSPRDLARRGIDGPELGRAGAPEQALLEQERDALVDRRSSRGPRGPVRRRGPAAGHRCRPTPHRRPSGPRRGRSRRRRGSWSP